MSDDQTLIADDRLPHHPPHMVRIGGHLVEPEPPEPPRPVGKEVIGERQKPGWFLRGRYRVP
ncbi:MULTISPECIES: hypothetical protein [unclassified Streptomyces]|uniref:hypothetical protein n=1 Tax=unclassified Streptomyces TaxID=2593676 RepID=UPI00382F75BB